MRPPKTRAPSPPPVELTALLALAAAAVLPAALGALPGSGPPGALLLAGLPPTAIAAIACVLGLALAGATIVARDRAAPPAGGAR